ncbi:MAG: hypothetical protein QNJ98_15725 [Planctomycetota bacterium]|nr:hypothetical protein [Planctomycetota bacterium]
MPRWPVALASLLLVVVGPAPAEASETFESLLRRGETYLVQAQKAHTSGNRDLAQKLSAKAEDTLKAARRLNARDLRVWFLGCQAAAFRGDRTAAAAWYEGYRARTIHIANDPDLQFLQAFIYIFAADNPDRAIDSLTRMQSLDSRRRALQRDTLMYLARWHFGLALMRKEQNLAAVKQFSEAARVARRRGWQRKELAAMGNSGIALKLASEWKQAVALFDTLIARDPENILWYWHKGLAFGSEHKFADALPVYRKVMELLEKGLVHPQHKRDVEMVYMRYGNSLRQLAGRITQDVKKRTAMLTEAETHLTRYTKLHPKDARGYVWLGELYFRELERPYKAIGMYEKALELDWVCGDVPLRSLVQIYTQNPPMDGPGTQEEREEAWHKRRLALIKQRDEGADKRKAAREERERTSPEHTDGCS